MLASVGDQLRRQNPTTHLLHTGVCRRQQNRVIEILSTTVLHGHAHPMTTGLASRNAESVLTTSRRGSSGRLSALNTPSKFSAHIPLRTWFISTVFILQSRHVAIDPHDVFKFRVGDYGRHDSLERLSEFQRQTPEITELRHKLILQPFIAKQGKSSPICLSLLFGLKIM